MSIITNDNVISTVVLSLDAVISYFQSVLPGVSFVYDENLGYETGMTELRASNSLRDQFQNSLPAFFFKRSVLRPAEQGMGRRSATQEISVPSPATGTAAFYNTIQGMYDVEFIFITPSMAQMENFEVSWLSENGITAKKQVDITLSDIGSMPYFLKYDPLSDKNINSTGNYYKAVTGIMQVQGWFLVFNPNDSLNAKIIKEINATVQAFSKVSLGTIKVVPGVDNDGDNDGDVETIT